MTKIMTKRRWYMTDVFRWRTGASITWSLLLLPLTVALYVFLVKINVFHPCIWLCDWLGTILSFPGCTYIVGVGILMSLVACSNVIFYNVAPTVYINRLSIILGVVKPYRIVHALCHALAGGMTARCLAGLIGSEYGSLIVLSPNEGNRQCLNELHLFIVLYGVFTGFLYSTRYFQNQAYYMDFPVIQQLKFFQVKAHMWRSLYGSLIYTVRSASCFYVLFYIFGSAPKFWLLSNLSLSESSVPVDSIAGLLDITLLWNMVMTGAVVIHLWGTSLFLFKTFTTEVYQFPVESFISGKEERCLHKALNERSNNLVKYLAYQDLSLLAEHGPERRKHVYSLSQPGGHPQNWARISSCCLELLDSLTHRLTSHQELIANGLSRQKQELQSHAKEDVIPLPGWDDYGDQTKQDLSALACTFRGNRGPYLRSSIASPITPVPASAPSIYDPALSPAVEVPHGLGRGVAVSGTGGVYDVGSFDKESTRYATPQFGYGKLSRQHIHEDQSECLAEFADSPKCNISSWQHRLAFLRRWRLGSYLLSPLPEAVSRDLFANVQLHIWASEALSSLVTASYREDTYGVVQGTLSDVLVCMLALHCALEKHFKLPTSLSRRNPSDFRPAHPGPVNASDRLQFGLRSTVTTSLHRMVAMFGPHLKKIPLAPEYKEKLIQFMEYKQ